MSLISIIMPVYNSDKYIRRSIDSIIRQTYQNWELILVDDGSTDASGRICDEYAELDPRIHVIHKENGGVASARQVGTDEACGEYSIHCDADDWIEPTMLEDMYSRAKDVSADIVVSNFYYNYSDKSESIYTVNVPSVASDFIKEILYGNSFGALWHKLIRHSLYRKFKVRFVDGVNYCEDVLVLAQFLKNEVRIEYLDNAYYHYCLENEDSITRNYTRNTYQMRQSSVKALRNILPDSEYKKSVDYFALLIKWEAIQKGIIKWSDINNCRDYMKTPLTTPFSVSSFALRNKVKYVVWYLCSLVSLHRRESKV